LSNTNPIKNKAIHFVFKIFQYENLRFICKYFTNLSFSHGIYIKYGILVLLFIWRYMVNSTGYLLGFQLIIWLKIYLNVHVHDLYKVYHVLYIKKISSDRELGYSFISYSLSFLDFTKDMTLKKETFLDMYLTITDPLFHYNDTYFFWLFHTEQMSLGSQIYHGKTSYSDTYCHAYHWHASLNWEVSHENLMS
jgi:hypothetical protein